MTLNVQGGIFDVGKKITFIGAGSVQFTQGLVADMIKTYNGEKWQLALVDIDPKALDVSKKLCEKMLKCKGADIRLSYSTDRCDVLPGSDYVVTMIAVGGRRAWEQDVFIPRKYGIFQPVGDSVMPGGISRAMRMIPVMLDIIRDVERLCPNAKFFNYANPMAMICRALRKAGSFPVVGLCHGIAHTENYLARFAGIDKKLVSSFAVGLNHLTFIYDFRYEGKDAISMLREKLEQIKKQGIDYTYVGRGKSEMDKPEPPLDEPFSWEIFETYGAFPAPGDRHITEFFADRFKEQKSYYMKTLGIDAYSFEQTIEAGDRGHAQMEVLAESVQELPENFFNHFSGEHEQLMNIIHSIEHDSRTIFSANIPNNGAIKNLQRDSVLEMPAIAGAKGLIPLQVNDFPDVLAMIISRHIAIVEAAVDAALKGDRNLFAEAVLAGGYITDKSAVVKMVDDMLKTQARYLPQFM
jgi:alpha-galactosidase